MSHEELSIGTKNGCFTVIGIVSPEEYQEEVKKEIDMLEKAKQDFIKQGYLNYSYNVEKYSNHKRNHKRITDIRDIVHTFPNGEPKSTFYFYEKIASLKSYKKYKCKCKCGKIHFLNEDILFRKKHRHCGEDCELIKIREQRMKDSYQRKKDNSYDIDYTNTVFESLEIIECIDDNFEGQVNVFDKRKKGAGICWIHKLYKCRCYLCGKEYNFKSGDFEIKFDTYGIRAKDGYYSDTYCNCHEISSFQWRTIKIFQEYKVKYKVEKSFPDLYGIGHKNLLRYDFVIFDSQDKIKYLIECQGEQHYRAVEKYGGISQYQVQVKNDELKRKYAKEHDIPLIEIPYSCNTYKKEEDYLRSKKIIW